MAMVPMFHANAWGLPYASTLVGAKQVFPGNSMTPDRVLQLMQDERVTLGAGVPTIWIGSLPLLQAGKYDVSSRDAHRLRRLRCAARPDRGLREARAQHSARVGHDRADADRNGLDRRAGACRGRRRPTQLDFKARQGMPVPGVELRVIDGEGTKLPGTARPWASWSPAGRG